MSAKARAPQQRPGAAQAARGAAEDRALGRWRAARGWIAGGAAVALIATIAVVASGFDARETPREEPSVWVTREAGQYARVNTETGEIDTVRKVSEPSSVLQAGAESVILTNGNGRAWPVDAVQPVDLADESTAGTAGGQDGAEQGGGEDGAASEADAAQSGQTAGAAVRMPDGTRDVIGAGRYVLLRTESGGVYLGTLAEGASGPTGGLQGGAVSTEAVAAELSSLQQIDPLADERDAAEEAAAGEDAADGAAEQGAAAQTGFHADAIALNDDGLAAMYSASDGTIWRFDAARGRFTGGEERLPASAQGIEGAGLALVSGAWVLLDPESGRLWRQGAGETRLEVSGGARLQASGDGDGQGAGGGDAALVADVSGLWRVPAKGAAERIVEAEGTPAQPVQLGNVRYAAWIGQNSGALWRSDAEEPQQTQTLEFDEAAGDLGDVTPTFFSNGSRAVLGEARSGMLWTLPDGRLIPLSQWSISDPPKEDRGTVVVEEVTEQVAPVAVADAFGVRQGEPAPLPVLLNDYDSNKRDVLTIVPESLGEAALPGGFGTVELMPDGQSLMVHPEPGASGTATFGYRITDGSLTSELATVTLTVFGDETNTAPEWCPVEGCQRAWGVPPLAPGGTLVYPILEGWVDPEGDPMMLADVQLLRPEDPARALITADGRLAVRHTDVNAGASEIMLRLTVRDSRGEERQRELQISVQPNATPVFTPMATTVQVGRSAMLQPLERVAGGSGSFVLTDATVQAGGDRVKAVASTANGTVEVVASEAGEALVSLGIRDTVTGGELTGVMRITATPGAAQLTLPPLRAFVRPLADSTVEVLDTIPNAGSRALAVQSANVVDGQLRAEVIEHARVRVTGSTPDGGPGRIGSADITVADGGAQATGRLTVFQVADAGTGGAIAVADAATVRAGAVVDIRVLDNDVAPPGERLILHPEVTGSGAEGELAFASGGVLRYLAPETPGTYRLNYTTYGASSPEASDMGTVTVTVLPKGANRDPEPRALTARVAAGEQTEVQVPLSGVDPDGDRVRLIGVGQIDDPQLAASITAAGTGISIVASNSAAPGVRTLEYSVRDTFGGRGTGTVRIVVTPPASDGGAPVASTDYVRLVLGSEASVSVRPLDNDIDPARGNLKIVSVEPNVPGGAENPEYQQLKERLDISELKQGVVGVKPGEELGTVSYRYTVRSSASKSTSDGLILVQTSERVGAQAPAVTDTVLNVRDRAELPDTGVDVVTDKVRWAAGDPSSLKLSLWSDGPGGYRVDGDKILGRYNPDGDLVVFRLDGVDASGTEVSSYGFLIIPPLDELRVTLKPGLSPLSVDENKSVDAGVRSLVDLGPGDRIELKQGAFPVGRSQGSCEATSEDTLRYSAGAEAPWEDTCLIDVRLVGQKAWTSLPVPVNIVPRAPIVQLNPLTRTVAPGGTETIDLKDMVGWQGDRAGDVSKLRFDVSGAGSIFQVSPSGTTVTVDARADAPPGSQENLSIGVSGVGESRATLTLRVGEAPRDLPKGGTVGLTCTVGSSCSTQVVGVPGEYDPFAGKRGGGLKLDTVNGAGCTFGTISRAGDTGITVAWPDNRGPGGRCTVGFTVRDAQGRSGSGTIEFDAQGVPRAPSTIRWSDFTGESVTFMVELGAAQSAHPAVSGVEVQGPGNPSCAAAGPASYQCVVTGLRNGSKGTYTARAVNAVGPSDPTSQATAWAYASPTAPRVTVTQLETPDNTDPGQGQVQVTVDGPADVRSYQVTAPGVQPITINGASGTTQPFQVGAGQQTFTAVPTSMYDVPPIGSASPQGGPGSKDFRVAGAPRISNVTFSKNDETHGIVTASGVDANGPQQPSMTYGIAGSGWFGGGNPQCSQADPVFQVQSKYSKYRPIACAQTPYGKASLTGDKASIGGSMPAPTGSTYRVATTPSAPDGSGAITYGIENAQPVVASVPDAKVEYSTGDSIVLDPNNAVQIQARQCLIDDPESCSNWVTLSPETAPTSLRVAPTGSCIVPDDQQSMRNAIAVSNAANWAGFSVAYDAAAGTLTVTWNGQFSSLGPAQLLIAACATTPPDPPDPPVTEPTTP